MTSRNGSPLQKHAIFQTELGWMLLVYADRAVESLKFGLSSKRQAVAEISGPWRDSVEVDADELPLAERLLRFCEGEWDDFRDVLIVDAARSQFHANVIKSCRRIPPGKTLSYAALAEKAGNPGAPRAVGSHMSRNPVPIIVPCHRVVGSRGGMGGYSAPGGLSTKQLLLEMESKMVRREALLTS